MKHPIKNAYENPKIDFLARDVTLALRTIPNFTIFKVITVWRPPFHLKVPYADGTVRGISPDVVKCERAVSTDSATPVTPGGTSWAWTKDQVRIDKIEGLEPGESYQLTFMVIGG